MAASEWELDQLNLDGMTAGDLAKLSEQLFALWYYASIKHTAMLLRSAGNIAEAIKQERLLEDVYKDIPDNWRW